MLIDAYGRVIDYLRISLTQRCNFRCQYCMPESGVELGKHENMLSHEEMFEFVKICIDNGIKKVRISGGEPLVRKGAEDFIAMIFAYAPHIDLAMTTNGYFLAAKAQALKNAGLKRLNISLDTLNNEKFKQIARRDGLEQVLQGIEAAKSEGLGIKLNTVAIKGFNDDEFDALMSFAAANNAQIRFIEYMENKHANPELKSMRADEILSKIATFKNFKEITKNPQSPSRLFACDDGYIFGLINPHQCDFCTTCNRIRLSSDGLLIPCLYFDEGKSILAAMKKGDLASAKQILADVLANKPEKNRWQENQISERGFYQTGG